MQQAMKNRDGKHYAVVTLRYFDKLSYEEIAQVVSIPLGTVRSRLNTTLLVLCQEVREGRNKA
jgi:RNA polymerase sigma-70 factor (ECF subfamily)